MLSLARHLSSDDAVIKNTSNYSNCILWVSWCCFCTCRGFFLLLVQWFEHKGWKPKRNPDCMRKQMLCMKLHFFNPRFRFNLCKHCYEHRFTFEWTSCDAEKAITLGRPQEWTAVVKSCSEIDWGRKPQHNCTWKRYNYFRLTFDEVEFPPPPILSLALYHQNFYCKKQESIEENENI